MNEYATFYGTEQWCFQASATA